MMKQIRIVEKMTGQTERKRKEGGRKGRKGVLGGVISSKSQSDCSHCLRASTDNKVKSNHVIDNTDSRYLRANFGNDCCTAQDNSNAIKQCRLSDALTSALDLKLWPDVTDLFLSFIRHSYPGTKARPTQTDPLLFSSHTKIRRDKPLVKYY